MPARFLVPFALGSLLGLWPYSAAAAASPSFDCENAKSAVERMICEDDELAALDVEMAKAFARALSRAPAQNVGEIKSEQSLWRRQLLRCDKSDDGRACALEAYRTRLGQL